MATPRRSARPGLLLWLNTTAKLRARLFTDRAREEMTVTPEDTLRAAGISTERQAKYQRRMSSLWREGPSSGAEPKTLLRGADLRLDDLDRELLAAQVARPRDTRHSSRARAGDGASGMRNHGKAVDPERQCEAPVRGQHNRRCLNRPLLGSPFCFHHSYEASEPKGAPEPGYEWYPLRDGLGRPYLWFQLRTDKAKRQARYLNRHGATPSVSERAEIRRVLGEELLRRK